MIKTSEFLSLGTYINKAIKKGKLIVIYTKGKKIPVFDGIRAEYFRSFFSIIDPDKETFYFYKDIERIQIFNKKNVSKIDLDKIQAIELDKMSKIDLDALHEKMSKQKISISKKKDGEMIPL